MGQRTHARDCTADIARLRVIRKQIGEIEQERSDRLKRASEDRTHAMVRLLARVIGIGVETADMLANEILARKLRDRRAVARYAGLTGAPDESGRRRREKGLARAGNARDSTGLALPHVPKGQRAGAMVPRANAGPTQRHAQNDDRRVGAQAACRAMANGNNR